MADVYRREIDTRFVPVIDQVLKLANLQPGETVLDLGTGTGAIAILAATQVGTTGRIKAIDISPEMLTRAAERLQKLRLTNVDLAEGRAEALPTDDGSIDAVIASLSLMYVIDRAAAAQEITACGRSCGGSNRRCGGACTTRFSNRGNGWGTSYAATSTTTPCR
jgi:ubiquinone/menaquinone biosynthesis C-methylase UbiE